MWIYMRKPYNGPLGSFDKGSKYDLAENTVSQLPKSCYKKTCAPWDEYKDEKGLAADKLRTQAVAAKLAVVVLKQTAAELREKADQLVHPAEVARHEEEAASKKVEAVAPILNSEKATDAQKAKAAEIVRASERALALRDKAQAELMLAIAEARLATLDAEDTEREAKSLCEKAGIKFDDSETKQPETAAGADGQQPPAEDAADTEGQADKAE